MKASYPGLVAFALLGVLGFSFPVARYLGARRDTAIQHSQMSAVQDLQKQAKAALSVTSGTFKLAGLEQPVEILRDSWGVAHIYAQNQHDLFFAQGFVTAQDRLFQMELWKRVGQGRLAEVLGPKYLARDINARLLSYRGSMQLEYASYAADTKQILEAFTQGINAYITTRTVPGGQELPFEFRLADFTPELWRPEDCLMRMAGFAVSRNAVSELANSQLVTLLGAEKASSFLNLDPPVQLDPAPGIDFSGLSPQLLDDLQGSDSALAFSATPAVTQNHLELPNDPGSSQWASNAWVVSGKLTKSGRPLLCNDPHRVVDKAPALRYLVHLSAPGWNVFGATEPALPGVQAGHNQRVAWGWTNFGIDQQDLYLEKTDPKNRLRYKTKAGWENMRVEKATFKVKGQASVDVDLKFTRHGAVVWEDPATHRALALRWMGAEPGTAGYLGYLTMDRVRNWKEFEEAVKRLKVPTHNIVYADIDGNIGEHSVGASPVRRNWTGTLPEPGDGGYEWAGSIPVAELPHQFNPERGFVVTANQRMIPDDFRYNVAFQWAEPYRANRITELLSQAMASRHKLTLEDMEHIQSDVSPLPAREMLHLLSSAAGNSSETLVRLLLNWNGSMDRNSAAAVLYELWRIEVEKQVVQLLVPRSAWNVLVGHMSTEVVIRHLKQADKETFGTKPQATRDQLLLNAVKSAAQQLNTLQGPDPTQWSWGRLHKIIFHHPLERVPNMKTLVEVGPVARPGDGHTVNATVYSPDNFEQTHGASYRAIMDVGNWDNSMVMNAPGQSGQPGSPHYSDLVQQWDQVRYFPMLYSRGAVEKNARERMNLEPASPN
jgi:penicillin G amidase